MAIVVINLERCDLCRICLDVCPQEALFFVQNRIKVNRVACAECGTCLDVCPQQAIQMQDQEDD